MMTATKSAHARALAVLRGLFFLLMATTGIAKLLDMPGFIGVVASYQSLPGHLLAPSAWALALAETTLAAWLLWGRHLHTAAMALVLMHLVYLAWLLWALARNLHLPNCGCFGAYWAQPLSWFSPLEDLALLALAAIFFHTTRRAPA
jgi:uncharacterized membrane protein YphA (DoxX/SURF4 family)